MPAKEMIFDLSQIDTNKVVANIDEIRRFNPQRFEMEQLTAIVYEDLVSRICIGYRDVTDKEFWVRGHMPEMPLMPGVVMLEVAAQVCSYFTVKHKFHGDSIVGFGGLEEVRFRDPVYPGDRLIMVCELTKVRPQRMVVCSFQGFVRDSVVVEGILKGVPIAKPGQVGIETESK